MQNQDQRSVYSEAGVETNGKTDMTNCSTLPANAVGDNTINTVKNSYLSHINRCVFTESDWLRVSEIYKIDEQRHEKDGESLKIIIRNQWVLVEVGRDLEPLNVSIGDALFKTSSSLLQHPFPTGHLHFLERTRIPSTIIYSCSVWQLSYQKPARFVQSHIQRSRQTDRQTDHMHHDRQKRRRQG